jgi:hypothetical protein
MLVMAAPSVSAIVDHRRRVLLGDLTIAEGDQPGRSVVVVQHSETRQRAACGTRDGNAAGRVELERELPMAHALVALAESEPAALVVGHQAQHDAKYGGCVGVSLLLEQRVAGGVEALPSFAGKLGSAIR